jgi:hypothetical protein
LRRILVGTVVGMVLLVARGTPAQAEQSVADQKNAWPSEVTKRPLTLARGMLELWVPVQLNASTNADWKPVTLNPSIAFGISDQWTFGVRHIVGLCIGGTSNGCPDLYDDVGAFTRVAVGRAGGLDFALQGGLDWVHIHEPRNWAAWAGLVLRGGGRGSLAFTVAPAVSFGLKDRDVIPSRAQPLSWNVGSYDVVVPEKTFDNREHLSTPVTLQLQLGTSLAVEAGASLEGPLDPMNGSFWDEYRIPVGVAAIFTPLKSLDVGAAFTWPQLLGKNNSSDARAWTLFLTFRT